MGILGEAAPIIEKGFDAEMEEERQQQKREDEMDKMANEDRKPLPPPTQDKK
jgi:hypothetical protein